LRGIMGLLIVLGLLFSAAAASETDSQRATTNSAEPNGARGYETAPEYSGENTARLVPRLLLFPVRAALYTATYPVRLIGGAISGSGYVQRRASGFRNDRYFVPVAFVDPLLGSNAGFRAGHGSPFHQDGVVTYRLGYGSSREYLAAMTFRSKYPRRTGWSYRFTGKIEQIPRKNYFGMGNLTNYNNRSFYSWERYLFLGKLSWAPVDWQRWDFTVGLHRNQISGGSGLKIGETSIEQIYHSESIAPGLWVDPNNIWGEVALTLDNRNCYGRPTAGWWAEGFAGYAKGSGTDIVNYTRYGGELQGYIPIGEQGTLVFRGAGEEARTSSTDQIKFTELISLGGRSSLRGYVEDRFVDNAAVMGSAELRLPVASGTDACLFADFGKVMDRLLDFDMTDIHRSWGAGLNFATNEQFCFRCYGAVSDECWVLNFTLESAFDREDRRDRR
jgi:Omp85 superfamily domain